MPKKIGVIGLGSIGSRHAGNLLYLGCDVYGYDPQIAGGPWKRWNGKNPSQFDGIVIASPTTEHAAHVAVCAGQAKIFCEKPIANKMFDFLTHVDMVGYNLRFHSCVKKTKEFIDGGLIGQFIWGAFTCAQYNERPTYLRDGVIFNWSHEIDLALYLMGEGKLITAAVRSVDNHDHIANILIDHGRASSSIHLDYLSNPELRGFTIVGTKGNITADLVRRCLVRTTLTGAEEIHIFEDSFDENYVEEMQAFIDRIDGKETIGATAKEGIDVLKICLDVRQLVGLP